MEHNQRREIVKMYRGMAKEGRLLEWKKGFRKIIREGKLDTNWSLREQFEDVVPNGAGMLRSLADFRSVAITEGAGAVSSADFANINGQIIYSTVMKAFEADTFIGGNVCPDISTVYNGEKIPGITGLGNDSSIVPEGERYNEVGVSEEYIETPLIPKRGLIVSVTKEAIFFDRTNLLLQRAAAVGTSIGISKERRILSTVLGVTNTYKKNGTTDDTYGNSAGTHDWDNLSASTGLQDWSDVDTVLQLLAAIRDPNTGEPIMNEPNQIIIPRGLATTANRIMNATEVRSLTNTSFTTLSPNPIQQYEVLSNEYVAITTSSATTWFMGNFRESFGYMQNWPMEVTSANAGATAEFEQDIVVRHKASEKGTPAVLEPRKSAKATA